MKFQYPNTYIYFFWGVLLLVCFAACQKNPPEGMVYFSGGTITIGSNAGKPNEAPPFKTDVNSFYLAIHPVTVAQFSAFVKATGYVTDAEKFGNSGVFNFKTGKWELVQGAYWKYPQGPDKPKAKPDHPVTQVSWNDARAYCEWAERRLPTEIEWEYAAKNGRDSENKYSWGNTLTVNGTYKANVWQGDFPKKFTGKDGYQLTSPVGAFGKTPAGLTDMGGNVWEWTGTTYHLYAGNPRSIPKNSKKKVIRGGSFLCDKDVCHGYRVSARQFNTRKSATMNTGFRTAKDVL